jgi:hypothetical protein
MGYTLSTILNTHFLTNGMVIHVSGYPIPAGKEIVMEISYEVIDDIRNEVSLLEVKGDAVMIDALRVPADIHQQGGTKRREYKDSVEQQLLEKHRIGEVFVLWNEHGDCFLEKAV